MFLCRMRSYNKSSNSFPTQFLTDSEVWHEKRSSKQHLMRSLLRRSLILRGTGGGSAETQGGIEEKGEEEGGVKEGEGERGG
jgi:hypothetical protein